MLSPTCHCLTRSGAASIRTYFSAKISGNVDQARVRPARLFKRLPLFFVLSKTLGIMMLPVNFLMGLGLLGVILLATRFAAFGRKLVVASLVLLAGFSPLGNLLLSPLEQRFPPWNPARGAPDGIIVLGGSVDPDVSLARGTAVIRNAADRIVVAAELARRYPNARIVFSGGSANLISNDAKEGDTNIFIADWVE